MTGDGTADVMDVRCGSVLVGSLLAQDGFLPAYHMSKSSWISILLDETVPDEQIFPLIELSYDSVAPKTEKALVSVGFLRGVLPLSRLQHGQELGGLGAEGWIGPWHAGVLDQEGGPIQGGVSGLMLNSDKKHLLESYG